MESDVLDGIAVTDEAVSEVLGKSFSLKHYGVKGMRWGVTRERADLRDLTNEELKMHVERLRLEQQYSAIAERPSSVARGRAFTAKYGEKAFAAAFMAATTFMVQRALHARYPNAEEITKAAKAARDLADAAGA